ncbi:carotenoid biosynthesis protein, partial [Candidatus Gottesmanbacteria bacterium]|nr:carotenoid biosynthesis protein [Candidatus Gottesmanbacteria bacterium]
VPLSNFLGWFLTVYLFFQAFTFYIYKAKISFGNNFPKSYWYQAVLFYLTIAGGFVVNFLTSGGGKVTDNTGVIWNVRDIRESAVIVALYTMCFVSFLAIVRIKSWKSGE